MLSIYSLIPNWIEAEFHSLLILNQTVFECHSTSITLPIGSHSIINVSFDSQGISIETTCQWFLSLSLNRNQLMSIYSLIPIWIEVECHSLLILNITAFKYHSTSDTLLMTSCIPLHAIVSFKSQVISILISYQSWLIWFPIQLFLNIIPHHLLFKGQLDLIPY